MRSIGTLHAIKHRPAVVPGMHRFLSPAPLLASCPSGSLHRLFPRMESRIAKRPCRDLSNHKRHYELLYVNPGSPSRAARTRARIWAGLEAWQAQDHNCNACTHQAACPSAEHAIGIV
jgi:hypothetical protein